MKNLIRFSATLAFLTALSASALFASKKIVVSTIGSSIPSYHNRSDMDKVVDEIIRFWDGQIQQVLPDQPDLILLPEFFDIPSGYTTKIQEDFIKVRGTRIQDFIASVAKKNNCYIAFGTLQYDEKGLLRNSAVLIDRKGTKVGDYHKNFPTIGEIENGIVSGTDAPVFKCDFGTVGMAICFDLNFEELRDRFAKLQPDIMLFPSMYHGGHMQSNWAYACRSYFVGAISGRGTLSQVRDPLGEIVASSTNYNNFVSTPINLNARLVHLGYNEGKLNALKKKYGKRISIKDPGNLGPVLVSCTDDTLLADEILKEFEIETMHDYYNRSRAVRARQLGGQ
jgi:hypothetical protein